MPVHIIGKLKISEVGHVTFDGLTSGGIKVNGTGSVEPVPSSPGVDFNGAILIYDPMSSIGLDIDIETLDGLEGRHALKPGVLDLLSGPGSDPAIGTGSYAGRNDARLHYAGGIKIIAECLLTDRIVFKAGDLYYIDFKVNSV